MNMIIPNMRLHSTVIAEAVPKRILALMNVEGLSKHHVASHLQVQIHT